MKQCDGSVSTPLPNSQLSGYHVHSIAGETKLNFKPIFFFLSYVPCLILENKKNKQRFQLQYAYYFPINLFDESIIIPNRRTIYFGRGLISSGITRSKLYIIMFFCEIERMYFSCSKSGKVVS